jgi:hypothetical protein
MTVAKTVQTSSAVRCCSVAYDKTDAALLAAAPELLEALVDLLEVANSRGRRLGIDEGGPVLDKTREAIAKATQK